MFLSVTEVLITVIRMQCVSTHLEDLGVCVTVGSLETDLHAQVIYITCFKPSPHPSFPVCKYEGKRSVKSCQILVMSCKIGSTEGKHMGLSFYVHCSRVYWTASSMDAAWQTFRFSVLGQTSTLHSWPPHITISPKSFSLHTEESRWQKPGKSATAIDKCASSRWSLVILFSCFFL